MSQAFLHRPFTDHVRVKPTGVGMWKLANDVGFANIGDYENFSHSFDVTREKIYSPQTPERVVVANLVTEASMTMSLELLQMTEIARTIAFQSDPSLELNQAAAQGQVFELTNAGAGRIFPLGFRQISNVSVEGAGAEVYVAGVHYQFDAATGNFEIIEHPGGVERGDIEITFDVAAIENRKQWGFLSLNDIRGEMMFRSTNKYGPIQLVETWDNQFNLDGDYMHGSNSTDWGSNSVSIEVFADPTKPNAFQYGRVTDLPR